MLTWGLLPVAVTSVVLASACDAWIRLERYTCVCLTLVVLFRAHCVFGLWACVCATPFRVSCVSMCSEDGPSRGDIIVLSELSC